MEIKYKKLFKVKLNNKNFMIFMDEVGRKAFLEINDEMEYVYPEYEDFLVLNNIYNNAQNFISYKVPEYFFKEKTRVAALLLAIDIVCVGVISNFVVKQQLTKNQEEVVVTITPQVNLIKVENIKDLENIMGIKKVSEEEMLQAILESDLEQGYKDIASSLVSTVASYDYDFRVFKENIKTLKVKELEDSKLLKVGYVNGYYDVLNNEICIRRGASVDTIAHEMGHAMQLFYYNYNGNVYYRWPNLGNSLDEAMNSIVTNMYVKDFSYQEEKVVLNYLLTSVNFDIKDYNSLGIEGLIKKLENKYSDVDINYVINTIDAMKRTKVSLGTPIYYDDSEYLLEELFKICVKNIDDYKDDYYYPLVSFLEILQFTKNEDIFYKYLREYNEILEKDGYSYIITPEEIEAKIDKYQNISSLVTDENGIYPAINTNDGVKTITLDGKLEDFNGKGVSIAAHNMYRNIKLSSVKYFSMIGTPEYWENFTYDYYRDVLNAYDYMPMFIVVNEEYLGEYYIPSLDIAIRSDELGNVGYVIYKGKDIIWESMTNYKRESEPIKLREYIQDLGNIYQLNLERVANQDYLKNYIREQEKESDIKIKDDKVYIEPNYLISWNNRMVPLKQCYLFKYEKVVDGTIYDKLLFSLDMEMDYQDAIDINLVDNVVYFKDVLEYYGLLNEDTLEYHYTKEEIIELFTNYFQDIQLKQAR